MLFFLIGSLSPDLYIGFDPAGDGRVANSDDIRNVADVDTELVEGLDGFVNFAFNVLLALPAVANIWHLLTSLLPLIVIEVIPPLRLEEVDDLHAMRELLVVATKGHERQAHLLGEGLDPVLEVLTLVRLVVADDDVRLAFFEEPNHHPLQVPLGPLPGKVVEC